MFFRFVKGKKHILKLYKFSLEKNLQNKGFIIKVILLKFTIAKGKHTM